MSRPDLTCACGSPLAYSGRGRPPTACPNCQRERRNRRDRERYSDDARFREGQLAARRNRYAANVDRERERGKRYYAEHRQDVLAKARERAA